MAPAGMDQQVNEVHATPPLDAGEVMRLAKAARSAGFSKSGDAFTKPKEGFTRTSLQQLAAMSKPLQSPPSPQPTATSASQSVEEGSAPATSTPTASDQPPAPQTTAEGPASDHSPNAKTDETDETDGSGAHAATDPSPAAKPDSAQSEIPAVPSPATPAKPDSPESTPPLSGEGTAATDSAQPNASSNAGAVPPVAAKPDLELLDAEYKRGFYEGQKAAMERQEEQLNAAIDSFNAATEALAKDENIDLGQLSQAMYRAIAQLASERAGIAIDSHPDDFADRIERMVTRIRNRVETPFITLHPEDASLIQATLEARLSPRPLKIVADDSLKRGDVRVDVGEIGVMDLLDSAIDISKPARPETVDSAQIQSDAETGIETATATGTGTGTGIETETETGA